MDERAELILDAIRLNVKRRSGESSNESNIRHMNAFLDFIKEKFSARRFATYVQNLPKSSIRTTDRNYIIEIFGQSPEQLVMVAHYDTWAGFSKIAPGADDNKSGVETLKHYILRDLGSESPPELTHVYLFSGSEECGIRGLIAQFAVICGLYVASYGLAAGSWIYLLLSFLLLPLALYRIGITGTKHYLKSLSHKAKVLIQAAIAVDSVGEGRLYILDNEMGANFLRALLPYKGSEDLNDLLEEGAHLNGIKYNRFLAGGTTDSVAFLEERMFWKGNKSTDIPAAALLTMSPGKASPFVIGGKLHTKKDVPEKVHPKPLKETLSVIDYARHIISGGQRLEKPRELGEHHYARLYRDGSTLYLALKDAVEPNRRNINTIYKVVGTIEDKKSNLQAVEIVWWGVETTLRKEIHDFCPKAKRVAVDELTVEEEGDRIIFAKPNGLGRKIVAIFSGLLGGAERLTGKYSLAAMFLICYLVVKISNWLLELTLIFLPVFEDFFFDHLLLIFITIWVFQILLLFRLFSRELPAAMDNAYKHRNRADNYKSLRRTR
ncbi:M28 family peptidase [Thermodesulfobacteriota bacterium]